MTAPTPKNAPRECITFLEKPVSEDEMGIARTLKNFFAGLNAKNPTAVRAAFSEDARIHPLRTAQLVGVDAYCHMLAKNFTTLRSVEFRDIAIRAQQEHASAWGKLHVMFTESKPHHGGFSVTLQKTGEIWRIAATAHYPL